jgi:hypothetical protein
LLSSGDHATWRYATLISTATDASRSGTNRVLITACVIGFYYARLSFVNIIKEKDMLRVCTFQRLLLINGIIAFMRHVEVMPICRHVSSHKALKGFRLNLVCCFHDKIFM